MNFFPDRATFVNIGPLSIRWYALLILSGAFITYLLSRHNTRKMKYPDNYLFDLFFDVIFVGIIGARLWFCIFYDLNYYLSNPLKFLAIYEGGLAIHGGIIFGLIYAYYYCKKKHISFLRFGDAILPNVMIGQAIGRWGNFMNKEAHGPEVAESFFDGPLAFLKEGMNINGHYYHPTFFYEGVLNIIGFILIVFILKRSKHNKRGDMIWAYLGWYGIVRFLIEMLRTDALLIGNLKIAQIISLICIIIAILGLSGIIDKIFKVDYKPIVLFDLDGTLVDTEKGIIEAAKNIYTKYGKLEDFTEAKQREIIGPPIKDFFMHDFPADKIDLILKEFREENRKLVDTIELMPNAEKVLKTLKDKGYHIGIVSSKQKEAIELCLDKFKLKKYIADIVDIDDVKTSKPSREGIDLIIKRNGWLIDDVIYVGDTLSDIETANNYGAYTIAYRFNNQIHPFKVNAYIDDLSDILKIVEKERYFTLNND